MAKHLFITGTGTDIGKTYITSLIIKKMNEHGKKIAYYKAAMSGNTQHNNEKLYLNDGEIVKQISGINQPLEEMCPYIYKTPVSPHLASKIEGNPVNLQNVLQKFDNLSKKYDYITVEGSGGIVCPLRFDNQQIMLKDFIKKRNMNCLLVADAGLGTINSVVLTVEYMRLHNLTIKGIIFNNYNCKSELHIDNKFMCETLTGLKIITCVKNNSSKLNIPLEILENLYNS